MTDLVGQQLGNYRLTQLLGKGGFAEVYLGEHTFLKTYAAVKVLQGKMTTQDVQNFIAEAQIIAKLKHPYVVRVLEFGVENNIPFLVMDYAPQGTLRDRHPYGSVLAMSTILPYMKRVAAALQYAHDQRLIHRDIKPENMLVESNNDVLLSDFGIAVTAHKTQSLSTQEAIGTVSYMAPEQIKGKARPASDQYSLGIVVYEWLCGTCPFDGFNSIEIAMKHLSEPPPPFRKDLKISSQVEQVVMKTLAKDPQQRFPSVQEFANSLEQAFQSQKSTLIVTPPPKIPKQVGVILYTYHSYTSIAVALTWLPNGPHAAFGYSNGEVQVWDITTQKQITSYRGHTDKVYQVVWAPDGKRIASGSDDKTIQIWDSTTGKSSLTYRGHGDRLDQVAWALDGTRIVSSGHDNTVQIWEATTSQLITHFEMFIGNTRVELSPNNQLILFQTKKEELQVWNIATKQLITTYRGHTDFIRTAGWSPDGSRIVSGGDDNTARIWDATSGRTIAVYREHTQRIYAVVWSPDGTRVSTISQDQTLQIWDAATTQHIFSYHIDCGIDQTLWTKQLWVKMQLRWSPDGSSIALSFPKSIIPVWDAATGSRLAIYYGHTNIVDTITWSPDGTRIASSAKDETIHIWNAATTGNDIATYHGHSAEVKSLDWSPDGTRITSRDVSGEMRIWNTTNGNCISSRKHATKQNIVAWSPDGTRYVSNGAEHYSPPYELKVWDTITGNYITTYKVENARVQEIVWSPDGSSIASGGNDKIVRVWDAITAKTIFTCHGHSGGVVALAWSPDGTLIASADNNVRVWEATGGFKLQRRVSIYKGHLGGIGEIAWSPDSTRIASIEGTGYVAPFRESIHISDVVTGSHIAICKGQYRFYDPFIYKLISNRLVSPRKTVLAWSPDGKLIAAMDDDNNIHIWDTTSGNHLSTLCSLGDGWRWSPDSTQIVSSSWENTVQIWKAP